MRGGATRGAPLNQGLARAGWGAQDRRTGDRAIRDWIRARGTGVTAILVLAAGLLRAAPVRAEVRSGQIANQGLDFAVGSLAAGVSARSDGLHASREAGFESDPIDTGGTFSAIGPHWRGTPGVGVELGVSPDGVRWGGWIAVPEEGTIEDLREDGRPNPFAGESAGAPRTSPR
ncbi:MAG: hypothetical protein IPF66_00005 [Holophagales bacterium]|nr:hypothetical protein [Holophagales bacterium]